MEINDFTIKILLSVLSLVVAVGFGIKYTMQYAPVVNLSIRTDWLDKKKTILLIKLKVENKSKVKVLKDKIIFQLLFHDKDKTKSLSERVALEKKMLLKDEMPIDWNEPIEIMKSTRYLYPSEFISVERIQKCPANSIAHSLLQFRAKYTFLGRILANISNTKVESWTTTTIIT